MQSYINNTQFTPELIGTLPVIGQTVNKWRGRVVTLHAHPVDPDRLISVGDAFAGNQTIVADEPRSAFSVALDYIAHGKVYTYD